MLVRNNGDGTWTITIDDSGPIVASTDQLTIPAGSTPHQIWQQILAFCAANGIHLIPQLVAVNASGTTGTLLS